MTDIGIDDVLERLIPVIAEHLGVIASDITPGTHLAADLRLTDKMDIADLVIDIQNEFKVEFSDAEVEKLVTVEDILLVLIGKGLTTDVEDADLISSDDKLVTDSNNVFGRVRAIIVDQLVVEESAVILEARLVEDLGADSLGVVELVMLFEEEFGLKVPDKELGQLVTVGDVVNFLVANLEVTEKEISASKD